MIDIDDVVAASGRIGGHVHRTPTIHSRTLSERIGAEVYLKLELFQKTGSFKPRGVFNGMLQLTPEQRDRGVVGVSGGNFAQGVAYAGATLGISTTIHMPETTPENYLAATRGYGATVELAPDIAGAFAGAEAAAASGAVYMHPFDSPSMMAGNGTVGLEIAEDVPAAGHVVVSIGGGGFMTGVTTAVKARIPGVKVWGVETVGADAMARSLAAGKIVAMEITSIAKTLGAPYVAIDALATAQQHLEDVVVVPDAEAVAALFYILERVKVLTEPAAACTLAAAERLAAAGVWGPEEQVVLILCGGNASAGDLVRWREAFPG